MKSPALILPKISAAKRRRWVQYDNTTLSYNPILSIISSNSFPIYASISGSEHRLSGFSGAFKNWKSFNLERRNTVLLICLTNIGKICVPSLSAFLRIGGSSSFVIKSDARKFGETKRVFEFKPN